MSTKLKSFAESSFKIRRKGKEILFDKVKNIFIVKISHIFLALIKQSHLINK